MSEYVKLDSSGSRQTASGTNPVNLLPEMSSSSTMLNSERLLGITPVKEFHDASRTVRLDSLPSSGGRQPERSLLRRMSSFKVWAMFPTVVGTQPENLLLARTATETVELPRVSGSCEWNRLWLRKSASRSLSNNSAGNGPSNSLYRRSKYLSAGRPRTCSGNGPTNRLLLRSSSWRRVIREKLLGTTPQKRLELMWSRARSVSSPSSAGR